MKFSLLINMKMPTIVGIFIFLSREKFIQLCIARKTNAIVSSLRFISKTNFMLTSGPGVVRSLCGLVVALWDFYVFCQVRCFIVVLSGFCLAFRWSYWEAIWLFLWLVACISLTLCYFVVCSARRFVVCLSVCHFVLVFFSPFSIAITSLGESFQIKNLI